jgi:hypothetical protein
MSDLNTLIDYEAEVKRVMPDARHYHTGFGFIIQNKGIHISDELTIERVEAWCNAYNQLLKSGKINPTNNS